MGETFAYFTCKLAIRAAEIIIDGDYYNCFYL